MKNALIGVFLVTTLVFGGLYLDQRQKTGLIATDLSAAQKSIADLQARVDTQETGVTKLQERLETTRVEADTKADQVAELKQALTNRPAAVLVAATNKPANPFAEMFKKPAMREMIKKQQKTMMVPMIEKNYADIIKTLNLTPEQATTLKDLVGKRLMVGMDAGMAMMSGDVDADKRKELTTQTKADEQAINDQIKQFLGDDDYAQFKAYRETEPDRTAVDQFKDQLGTGANALTADEQQQLIQAMSEERKNFKFTTDYTDKSKFDGDLTSYFSEDKMTLFFQEQEHLNAQYVERARNFLTADQLAAYEKNLADRLEMQKTSMKIAANMFSQKSGGN